MTQPKELNRIPLPFMQWMPDAYGHSGSFVPMVGSYVSLFAMFEAQRDKINEHNGATNKPTTEL